MRSVACQPPLYRLQCSTQEVAADSSAKTTTINEQPIHQTELTP
jgi:hypothetical protein